MRSRVLGMKGVAGCTVVPGRRMREYEEWPCLRLLPSLKTWVPLPGLLLQGKEWRWT